MVRGIFSPQILINEGINSYQKAQNAVFEKEDAADIGRETNGSFRNAQAEVKKEERKELKYVFGDSILMEIGEKRLEYLPDSLKQNKGSNAALSAGKATITEIRNYFNYLEALTQLRLIKGASRDSVDFGTKDELERPRTGTIFNLSVLYDMVYGIIMSHIPEKNRTPETEETVKLYLFFNLVNVPWTAYMNRIHDYKLTKCLIPNGEKFKETQARRRELLK